MIRNFYVIKFFFLWPSICIQDIVLHYQINPVRLIWLVFCIRFVWRVNLMKMIIYMFRTQKRIKNPAKHLRWSFLQIRLLPENPSLFSQKSLPWKTVWALNTPLEYQKLLHTWTTPLLHTSVQGKVNTYVKMKSRYCQKSVVSMRKLVRPNSYNNYSEMFRKKRFLNF